MQMCVMAYNKCFVGHISKVIVLCNLSHYPDPLWRSFCTVYFSFSGVEIYRMLLTNI